MTARAPRELLDRAVKALEDLLYTAEGDGNEGEPGYQVSVDGKAYERARAALAQANAAAQATGSPPGDGGSNSVNDPPPAAAAPAPRKCPAHVGMQDVLCDMDCNSIEGCKRLKLGIDHPAPPPLGQTGAMLDELDALERKATKGPWWSGGMKTADGHALAWLGNAFVDTETPKVGGTRYREPQDDAAFIAALRNAYPLIKAAIESLRRGEYICNKCGTRKDAEHDKADF